MEKGSLLFSNGVIIYAEFLFTVLFVMVVFRIHIVTTEPMTDMGLASLAVAGTLVGFGTQLGNDCSMTTQPLSIH